MLKKNLSNADRALRILLALVAAVLLLAESLSGAWALVAGILGVTFILTSVFSFCPLYALLGLSTRKSNAAE